MPAFMSGGKGKRTQAAPKRREDFWSKFVPGDLTDNEKADVKAWSHWDEAYSDMLDALGNDGIKFSVKLDGRGQGFICFLQPAAQGHRFDGWMLSGRGSTAFKALRQACWRHFVLYDTEWPLVDKEFSPDDFGD